MDDWFSKNHLNCASIRHWNGPRTRPKQALLTLFHQSYSSSRSGHPCRRRPDRHTRFGWRSPIGRKRRVNTGKSFSFKHFFGTDRRLDPFRGICTGGARAGVPGAAQLLPSGGKDSQNSEPCSRLRWPLPAGRFTGTVSFRVPAIAVLWPSANSISR
jgi:hypothetical protein